MSWRFNARGKRSLHAITFIQKWQGLSLHTDSEAKMIIFVVLDLTQSGLVMRRFRNQNSSSQDLALESNIPTSQPRMSAEICIIMCGNVRI
jgi:hypothetical protein